MLNWISSDYIEGAGVIISIFLIIYLIRNKWKMYWVLLIAIAVLAFTNNSTLPENLAILYHSLTSYTAFYLVSMVVAIVLMGHLHQEIGAMQQLVDNLRYLVRDPRVLLMVFPATISLFSTVPGGAIISAPMVEETGQKLNMSPTELAMSNMVYRHLIVLITPFNSSLVLASGITGISIAGYLGFTVPVIAIVFLIATIILFYRYPRSSIEEIEPRENGRTRQAVAAVLISAAP